MNDEMRVRTGFFPVVAADNVTMTQAGSSAVFSGGDVSLEQAGSNLLVAGGGVDVQQGGAMTMAVMGDATVEQGGALLLGARSVEVRQGFVGLALGGRVEISDSQVLLGPAQAVGLGAGFALVLVVLRALFRRG